MKPGRTALKGIHASQLSNFGLSREDDVGLEGADFEEDDFFSAFHDSCKQSQLFGGALWLSVVTLAPPACARRSVLPENSSGSGL
jgi:hypothetical protein